ncbi:MAG: hypothetical protein ACO1QB_18690 [Verrucomicrobiales bacterium]
MNAINTRKALELAVTSGSTFYLEFIEETVKAYKASKTANINPRVLGSMFSWSAFLAIFSSFDYRFSQIVYLASLKTEEVVNLDAIQFTRLEDGARNIMEMQGVDIRQISNWNELINLRNLRNLLSHSFGRVKLTHKNYGSLKGYIMKSRGIRLDLEMYIVMDPQFITHETVVLRKSLLSIIGLLPNLKPSNKNV